MMIDNEEERQNIEKKRIEKSMDHALHSLHNYIKDCIDQKTMMGYIAKEDGYKVWCKKLKQAESGRRAMVSAMKRLHREYGLEFYLDTEE